MIDFDTHRYLVKDRLTGHVDHYGHEETPCDLCYMKNGCLKKPHECWELDMYVKLRSFEVAMENGLLLLVSKENK